MYNNTFECPFCCNEEDNSLKISCPHCGYYCCLECAKCYLIKQKVAYVCPNPKCKKEWNPMFIYTNFPKEFIDNDLKKSYAKMYSNIDVQQFLPQFKSYANFCQRLDKAYKILIDNNINFEEIYDNFNYLIYGNEDINFENLCKDKIKSKLLDDIYSLVENYISKITLSRIFSIDYKDDMYTIYLIYNIIKNNTEDIIKRYHIFINDQFTWFMHIFNLSSPIEQQECLVYLKDKNYRITQLIKYFKNKSFEENYKIIEDTIKRIHINCKYKVDSNQQFLIGKCFANFCSGDIYLFKEHIICKTCNKIFCPICHVEIYPENIESFNKDNKIELIPNSLYSKYTDEQKYSKHICKEEDIETAKQTTINVKNCPNIECRYPIQKDEGCNDMLCSICGTMFNWITGEITKDTNNPNHFQWLRTNKLIIKKFDQDDDQNFDCNKQLNREQCNRIINNFINTDIDKFENFASLLELKVIGDNNDKMDIVRAKYAFGIIDNSEFSNLIFSYYMDKYFNDQFNSIIVNTIFTVSDLFRTIEQDQKITDDTILKMNKTVFIHNEGIKFFHNIYPSIKAEMINTSNYLPYFID